MDEACAMIRTEIDSMPTELDVIQRKIIQHEIEEAALQKESDKLSQEHLEEIRKELKRSNAYRQKIYKRIIGDDQGKGKAENPLKLQPGSAIDSLVNNQPIYIAENGKEQGDNRQVCQAATPYSRPAYMETRQSLPAVQ